MKLLLVCLFVLTSALWGQTGTTPNACPNTSAIVASGTGNTQIIATQTNKVINVCTIAFAAAAANNIKLTWGTGTNCGTGTTDLTGVWTGITQPGIIISNTPQAGITVPRGQALCINLSAANVVGGVVTWGTL
jgi:hypothetical protein